MMPTGHRILAVVAVAAASVVPVGLAAPSTCAAAQPADGEIVVAVAVDFGPLSQDDPSTVCVTVDQGATGADVLEARARQLGTPAPRYDSSGLLCAIDGLPAEGCGEPVAGGYRYWSYWHGTDGAWDYASVGPAGHRATGDVVEGWHFVEGDEGNNEPPGVAADPDALCEEAARERPAPPAQVGEGDDGDGGTAFLPVLLGVGAVAALVAVGVVTARRRARE